MDKGQPIRSIGRALDVIKTINRLRSPTMTEISQANGLPYPTTFRIIQTLIHEGMVESEPFRKRYRTTELVKSLSSGFQDDDRLAAAAQDAMRQFTATNLWPVTLTVRVGRRMMVKHSTHQLTTQTFINYYPGYTLPLLESASGQVYLAFCSDEERATITQGLELDGGGDTVLGLQFLRDGKLLAKIRSDGHAAFARSPHNETPGRTSAVAVPVVSNGRLMGALTFIFFANAVKMQDALDRHLAALQALASEIGANFNG